MEDLFIGRIGGRTDLLPLSRAGEILDMRNHGRSAVGQSGILLASADTPDVRGDSGVDDDIVFAGVIIDTQTSENDEATASVDFLRQVSQCRPKRG